MNYELTTIETVLTQLEGNTRSTWAVHIDTERMLNEFKAYEYDVIAYANERNADYNESLRDDIDNGYLDEEDAEFVIENVIDNLEDAYDVMEYLENEYNWTEVTHDNTYNWNAPLYNHIDFHVYKDDYDYFYVFAKMHISGDVRGNYTDYFVLRFDTEYDYQEALLLYSEHIDVNEWSVRMEIGTEYFNFYNTETHEDFEACCSGMDDIKEAIAEYEKE